MQTLFRIIPELLPYLWAIVFKNELQEREVPTNRRTDAWFHQYEISRISFYTFFQNPTTFVATGTFSVAHWNILDVQKFHKKQSIILILTVSIQNLPI